MFETERLILRAYRDSDLGDMLRLRNNPVTQRLMTHDYILPAGIKYIESVQKWATESLFAVIVTSKPGGDFMGLCHLQVPSRKNRDADLGVAFLPEYWGKGYGTEAISFVVEHGFRWLALHRVSLVVYEGNTRAIKVYKNLGFREEGRKRKANWVDGKWEDIIQMGLLEDEWPSSPGVTHRT
ncbi:hypothetical protein JAAARDRAFT_136698 [Jaapia argillacea MUCL 33604]|uniref:N-acetyltransferase domain-containing protein n=1 Tax=Jaapia argillacea MUCL 33604 TaxID=933084 RepID=A0A067PTJ5_9AGAM|nr:hypothetical protein JAAARDRAFT_136698 [Jaapia argillacea MUCL 33604]